MTRSARGSSPWLKRIILRFEQIRRSACPVRGISHESDNTNDGTYLVPVFLHATLGPVLEGLANASDSTWSHAGDMVYFCNLVPALSLVPQFFQFLLLRWRPGGIDSALLRRRRHGFGVW